MQSPDQCIFFVDSKPAEILDVQTNEFLCFVGATGSSHLEGFRQYKETRGLKKKLEKAEELAQLLRSRELEVCATAVTARMDGGFTSWATEELNEVRPKIGAEWKLENGAPTHFSWKEHDYGLNRVLGLGTYAAVLGLMGLGFARIAGQSGCQDLVLALDNLPGSSAQGMALIRAIHENNSHQHHMWKNNASHVQKITIANLATWTNQEGREVKGKAHPGFSLADWLAVGVKATVDPNNFREDLKPASREIQTFANVWKAAESQGPLVKLLDLENADLKAAVRDPEER